MQSGDPSSQKRAGSAFMYLTVLFFIWGAVTSVNDVLIPTVKQVFSLSDTESFLTQFAFFMAYGVVSLPAAALLGRLGSSRAIVLALATMVLGCLLMPLATLLRIYGVALGALFVIASGITLLQVAANPLSAALGDPKRSHFRLVLSQTFNSLGTVVGPYLAAHTLLKGGLFDGGEATEAKIAYSLSRIDITYGFIAAVILVMALLIWRKRALIDGANPQNSAPSSLGGAFSDRWALFGALAIFLYVGAEVSIGSAMVNFLEQDDVLAVSAVTAGTMVSLYWGGAMIGRLAGTVLLLRLPAGPMLGVCALAAAALCLAVSGLTGPVAGYAAISVGLFNSIMFPVIFSLTIERSRAGASATSGLLCLAIVGGAVVPLLFARVADLSGSRFTAFYVPLACYLAIALFGLMAWRAARAGVTAVAETA
ncbi:MAG TPA: sugar MFS transporter [Sphingobium sp.]|nr:sugar MFS transporter [Sphingobium sp.]